MIGYVYRITNLINGKVYIGSTLHLDLRLRKHMGNRGQKVIGNAINKYGETNFNQEVLAEYKVKNRGELYDKEQIYLDMYFAQEYIKRENKLFSKLTYNVSPNASGGMSYKWSEFRKEELKRKFKEKGHTCIGRVISEDTRKKISNNHISKGLYKGEKNPNFGIKTTPEKIDKFVNTWIKTGFIKAFYKIDRDLNIEGPIYNRRKYCRERSWTPKGIELCLKGSSRTYKGFAFCTEENLESKINEIKNESRYWDGYKFQNHPKFKN